MPHDVTMPQLGMAQDSGVIVSWQKKPGDPVKAGDVLMEVETDKATMEVEAVNEGFLAEIRAVAGAEVPVGDVIAVISESSDDVKSTIVDNADETSGGKGKEIGSSRAAKTETAKKQKPETSQLALSEPRVTSGKSDSRSQIGGRILASPKARWEAHQRGIDLGQLVRQGIPQPFHVADIKSARLQSSPASATATSTLHAKIDPAILDEFVSWADRETNGAVGRSEILAAFAAGAYRAALGDAGAERDIAVKFCSPDTINGDQLLDNPDLHGLAEQVSGAANGEFADIAIIDLLASNITGYNAGHVSSHAVFVFTGDDEAGKLAFSFSEDGLPLGTAVQLLNDLVGRIAEPLRHLL